MDNTKESKSLATIVGQHADGGVDILRTTESGLLLEKIVRVKEGQSLSSDAELINLKQIGEQNLFQVDTLYKGENAADRSGPAQVSTKAYRDGYDRIFGNSKGSDALN